MEDTKSYSRVREDISLKRIGGYQMKEQIGTGNFSKVKLAVHLITKEKVAIKLIDKSLLDGASRHVLSHEIACMDKLRHPNVIRLFEVLETFTHLYLVMEYASDGSLEERIVRDGPLSEEECRRVFGQVVSAVDYMHGHGVVHRDLKADNVYFSHKGRGGGGGGEGVIRGRRGLAGGRDNNFQTVKVGDFSFSAFSSPHVLLNTFCGSPSYSAPELLQEKPYAGSPVDAWALGVLLYYMLTGVHPFSGADASQIRDRVIGCDFSLPERLSFESRSLIRDTLITDPTLRLTPRDMLESDWLDLARADASNHAHSSNRPVAHLEDSSLGRSHAHLTSSNFDLGSRPRSDHTPSNHAHNRDDIDTGIIELMHSEYGLTFERGEMETLLRGEPRSSLAGTYRILHRLKLSRTTMLSPTLPLPSPPPLGDRVKEARRGGGGHEGVRQRLRTRTSKICILI